MIFIQQGMVLGMKKLATQNQVQILSILELEPPDTHGEILIKNRSQKAKCWLVRNTIPSLRH